jgi:hypothetical protein
MNRIHELTSETRPLSFTPGSSSNGVIISVNNEYHVYTIVVVNSVIIKKSSLYDSIMYGTIDLRVVHDKLYALIPIVKLFLDGNYREIIVDNVASIEFIIPPHYTTYESESRDDKNKYLQLAYLSCPLSISIGFMHISYKCGPGYFSSVQHKVIGQKIRLTGNISHDEFMQCLPPKINTICVHEYKINTGVITMRRDVKFYGMIMQATAIIDRLDMELPSLVREHSKTLMYNISHDQLVPGGMYSHMCKYKSICKCEVYKTAFKCLLRYGLCLDMIRVIINILRSEDSRRKHGHVFRHLYWIPFNFRLFPILPSDSETPYIQVDDYTEWKLDVKMDGDYTISTLYQKSITRHQDTYHFPRE